MNRKIAALVNAIEDPIDRAVTREILLLEDEIAHLVELQDGTPYSDLIKLRQDAVKWIDDNPQTPVKTRIAKLNEMAKLEKPLICKCEMRRKMDFVAVMDREFKLRRQLDDINSYRHRYWWDKNRQAGNEQTIASGRTLFKLESIRLQALAKSLSKPKQKAENA